MQTGAGTATESPVNVSFPVAWSIANTVTVPESWPAASRCLPPGAIAKCRGVLARVGSMPTNESFPLASSME